MVPLQPMLQFGNKYASDVDMVKEARPGPGSYDNTRAAFGKQVIHLFVVGVSIP